MGRRFRRRFIPPSIAPVGAMARMLGQVEEIRCTLSDGSEGFIDLDGNCVRDPGAPWPPPDPDDPPLGPGGKPLPPDFVAPGPTELHPERWDLDSKPCTYTLAYGDTYVGLAKTYLDPTGLRWREIWRPNQAKHPNPSMIPMGDTIVMPEEACENMRRWLNRGGPNNVNPSQIKPTIGDTARKWGALAIAAAAGVGLYWMS